MNGTSKCRKHLQIMSRSGVSPMEKVQRLAANNAVTLFSVSSCCLCHVVKRLLISLGVGPVIYELDKENDGVEIQNALSRLTGQSQAVPAVFIGGMLIGGLEEVMAAHISGALVPKLKEAGALWL
ncbi:hypothetical protein O6H91_04G093600 [Diphasiastrum complanatum]|uniref:Uncharacterized protein n=1 Tax=Diphasiastrum complanatum TaxID=34168 RepID=A0ACC2DZ41_DIPCM|nr:hypothetical protein O6H91_Y203800 [Diphasiastrum complanatum]KAJ7559618.1 hypothetical protein O6H91_04G093600 [Diphasiastrum complanatum]